MVLRHGSQQRLDLLGLEVVDIGVGFLRPRLLDEAAWIGDDELLPACKLEDRMQEPKHVARRLGRSPCALHVGCEGLHLTTTDAVESPGGEERHEMHPKVGAVDLERRALASLGSEVCKQQLAALLNGKALASAGHTLDRPDQAPQLCLGLRAGEAFARRRHALGADAALDLARSDAPLPVPGLAAGRVAFDDQRTGATRAPSGALGARAKRDLERVQRQDPNGWTRWPGYQWGTKLSESNTMSLSQTSCKLS